MKCERSCQNQFRTWRSCSRRSSGSGCGNGNSAPSRMPRLSTRVTNGPRRTPRARLAPEDELALCTVGQDEERDPIVPEVLHEDRLAELTDECCALGHDVLEGLVARDHTEVEVRILVGFAPRTGPAEERGDDSVVGRTSLDETRDHQAVVMCWSWSAHAGSFAGVVPAR